MCRLANSCRALLPEDYISDVGVRLSLYKRLASASSADEVADLAGEIEDRFGAPPAEARRLVHLMRLKTELRKLRVLACEAKISSQAFWLTGFMRRPPGSRCRPCRSRCAGR